MSIFANKTSRLIGGIDTSFKPKLPYQWDKNTGFSDSADLVRMTSAIPQCIADKVSWGHDPIKIASDIRHLSINQQDIILTHYMIFNVIMYNTFEAEKHLKVSKSYKRLISILSLLNMLYPLQYNMPKGLSKRDKNIMLFVNSYYIKPSR